MSRVEADISDLSERVHAVYGPWAARHANGEGIEVRPYDENEGYQRPDIAFFAAEPDFEMAERIGLAGMGEAAYQKLGDQYDDKNVLEIVRHRHEQDKSTLIPTLHLKDVLDTAMTHNRLFTVSGGDHGLAEINDVVVNPMMSRLTIASIAAMRVVTFSGNADNALPEGALKHGMDPEDVTRLARFYGAALGNRLGDDRRPGAAIAVHWALTGTRAEDFFTPEGRPAKRVERIKDGLAAIVVKRAAMAIPVPMIVEVGNCKVEVLEPRQLESVADVHKMMQEMVEAASELSGETIVYGEPKDIQEE